MPRKLSHATKARTRHQSRHSSPTDTLSPLPLPPFSHGTNRHHAALACPHPHTPPTDNWSPPLAPALKRRQLRFCCFCLVCSGPCLIASTQTFPLTLSLRPQWVFANGPLIVLNFFSCLVSASAQSRRRRPFVPVYGFVPSPSSDLSITLTQPSFPASLRFAVTSFVFA